MSSIRPHVSTRIAYPRVATQSIPPGSDDLLGPLPVLHCQTLVDRVIRFLDQRGGVR